MTDRPFATLYGLVLGFTVGVALGALACPLVILFLWLTT